MHLLFSFSLEGVLRSLSALVPLVSLISFIPLFSLFAVLQQQFFAATVAAGGNIYTSSNPAGTGDNNWAVATSAGARNWKNIGMNAAGTNLAAIDVGGFIYTSSVSFSLLFCDLPMESDKEGERRLTLPSFQFSSLPSNLEILFFLSIIQQDKGATWWVLDFELDLFLFSHLFFTTPMLDLAHALTHPHTYTHARTQIKTKKTGSRGLVVLRAAPGTPSPRRRTGPRQNDQRRRATKKTRFHCVVLRFVSVLLMEASPRRGRHGNKRAAPSFLVGQRWR